MNVSGHSSADAGVVASADESAKYDDAQGDGHMGAGIGGEKDSSGAPSPIPPPALPPPIDARWFLSLRICLLQQSSHSMRFRCDECASKLH